MSRYKKAIDIYKHYAILLDMRGLMNVFRLFGGVFGRLASMKMWLPLGFAGILVLMDVISVAMQYGGKAAFLTLAQKIAIAEFTIRENVLLAIAKSPEYGLINVLDIIAALILLYHVVKFFKNMLIGVAGAQAPWMAWIMGLIIAGIIEIAATALIYQEFFFPIYDGLVFLVFNIAPVVQNITIFGWYPFEGIGVITPEVSEIVNQTNQTASQQLSNSSLLNS